MPLCTTAAYKYISFHYDEIFAFSESDSAKISPMTSLTENIKNGAEPFLPTRKDYNSCIPNARIC